MKTETIVPTRRPYRREVVETLRVLAGLFGAGRMGKPIGLFEWWWPAKRCQDGQGVGAGLLETQQVWCRHPEDSLAVNNMIQ